LKIFAEVRVAGGWADTTFNTGAPWVGEGVNPFVGIFDMFGGVKARFR
jgi:hypothetical protein